MEKNYIDWLITLLIAVLEGHFDKVELGHSLGGGIIDSRIIVVNDRHSIAFTVDGLLEVYDLEESTHKVFQAHESFEKVIDHINNQS